MALTGTQQISDGGRQVLKPIISVQLHRACFDHAELPDSMNLCTNAHDRSVLRLLQPWQTRSPSRNPSCVP